MFILLKNSKSHIFPLEEQGKCELGKKSFPKEELLLSKEIVYAMAMSSVQNPN
jgi:hypothetical protein